MLSAEENDRLTRTGPGTAAGALLRSYWQPVALVEELPEPRPLKAVRLLGEDFILFRDERGKYGMLRRQCPHRGADLAVLARIVRAIADGYVAQSSSIAEIEINPLRVMVDANQTNCVALDVVALRP